MSEKIFYIKDSTSYKKLNSKYNMLSEYPPYKIFINNYLKKINTKFSNINIIKYNLFYIKNNDTLHIFFYNNLINSELITNSVSEKTIHTLFINIKKKVLNEHILLNYKYLTYILNLDRSNSASLIYDQTKNTKETIRLDFKIYNYQIKFYIRHYEIFNCNINELDSNIIKVFRLYKIYFKEYKKVALVIKDHSFSHHTSVHKLQKTFFEKGYWLDVSTPNENSTEREINKNTIYSTYDNIILDYSPDMTEVMKFKEKKIIMIPLSHSHDFNMKLNRNSTINLYKTNPDSNQLIHGIRQLDTIESTISTGYIHKYISADYKISYFNNSLHTESINCLKPDETNDNKQLLNKSDFFKTFNFDITKKLITIFLVWPVIDSSSILNKRITRGPKTNHKIFRPQFLNFEYNLYYKNSILIQIIDILQKRFNVAIKFHPGNYKIIDNKMYIYKGIDTDHPKTKANLDLNNIKDENGWGITNILHNYSNIIIDSKYQEELLTNTNVGFMFYPSTLSWYTHIYNFPMIHISTLDQNNDWFKWLDVNMLNAKCDWKNNKTYRDLNKIKFNKDKLFHLKDVIFGKFLYIEDISTDLESNLYNVITQNLKLKHQKYNEHPLFIKDTHHNIALKIIEIIEKKYNKIKPTIQIDVEPERR